MLNTKMVSRREDKTQTYSDRTGHSAPSPLSFPALPALSPSLLSFH